MEKYELLFPFVIAIIGYITWAVSVRKRTPPGPIGLPVVGYVPFLTKKPYLKFWQLADIYGNVFSLKLGSFFTVVLNDYESTRDAFAKDAFIGRPPFIPFALNKETIETQAFTGVPWKEHRRFALHMLRDLGFGKTVMEGHIQEEILELLSHFEQDAGRPTTIRRYLASSMSNNIASLVFGKRYPYNDPIRIMMTRTTQDSGRSSKQVFWQIFFPWLKGILKYFTEVDKVVEINKELRAYIMKEIKRHEKTLDPNNIRDFIDAYLLEFDKRKDDPTFCITFLQDLVGIFFGAGSETVRINVEWLILTMAAFPEVQRRVQSEIDEVLGQNLPIYTDHKQMPFTVAVISELMRWRTTVPINVLRYTLSDTEVNGYFIPKHSLVLSNLWAIFHDPKYWGPDADQFRPERFLSEDGKSLKKMERFVPFSTGKRACPGEPLAKIEVFLYFVSILQRFQISLPEGKNADFEGDLGVSLSPKMQEIILIKR